MHLGARNPEPLLTGAVVLLALIAGFATRPRRLAWIGLWERPLAWLARRERLAILVSAAIPLVVRAALLPLLPAPVPRYHDEFSFLLLADTLLHGRLANPPHPLWVHFESVHILARTVYASAFPAAQGAAIALGRLLFGNPWAGVWLSGGVMCGAICWMLQGFLPSRWAVLGTLLVSLRIAIPSYWMNTYWGGFVAAAGGALVLGALPRAMRDLREGSNEVWKQAVIMGIGFAILAHSRPFEGAVFGVGVAAPVLFFIARRPGKERLAALRRFVVPLGLALIAIGAFTCYYFWRITGNPLKAPYVLYRNSLAVAPHFVFQKPTAELLYNNRPMWDFYVNWEMYQYKLALNTVKDLTTKTQAYWRFYFGPLLSLPLLALLVARRGAARKQVLQLLALGAFFSLALLWGVWHNAHYAAPATGLSILLVSIGLRHLRRLHWRGYRPGLFLARLVPLGCLVMLALRIVAGPTPPLTATESGWRWPREGCVERAHIDRQLRESGGKHLVLVRYSIHHDPGDEWVYNGADIDNQPVVWARELDRASNARLLDYFSDRKAWLVEPDAIGCEGYGPESGIAEVTPYREAEPGMMQFVRIGAPGIEALRSPERIRKAVLEDARGRGLTGSLTCSQWNYLFSEVTSVQGPELNRRCYAGNDSGAPVPFDHWWQWTLQQPDTDELHPEPAEGGGS